MPAVFTGVSAAAGYAAGGTASDGNQPAAAM